MYRKLENPFVAIFLLSLCYGTSVIATESLKDKVLRERRLRIRKEKATTENLLQFVKEVEEQCGEVCDTTKEGKPSKYFNYVEKNFDCEKLFASPDLFHRGSCSDAPPRTPPKQLMLNFTHNGKVRFRLRYLDDSGDPEKRMGATTWMRNEIDDRAKTEMYGCGYGAKEAQNMKQALETYVEPEGKRVLVIGTELPWIETILVRLGALEVVTVDYADIKSEHPKIRAITPSQWAQEVKSRKFEPFFDAAVSFSSLEHSGLGRYGEMLNPWGDLMTMARIWCDTKKNGRAIVGVPTNGDEILFNEARIYGKTLTAQLFSNWNQISSAVDVQRFEREQCDYCTAYQPLHIVEK